MSAHLIEGEFQSDKYPTCPRGKVPLSVKDPSAQDLLWEYAQRRRVVDAEFSDDLETALRTAGYRPPRTKPVPKPPVMPPEVPDTPPGAPLDIYSDGGSRLLTILLIASGLAALVWFFLGRTP